MTETQILRDMLTGLKSRKEQLEADEKVFLKVSGLNEEIEKASQDRETYRDELKEAKERRDKALAKKAAGVNETTSMIEKKLNESIPSGKAILRFDDDKLKIGWVHSGQFTPYNGLSGGEKQIFDAALAHVLDADIIVVEAAELDFDSLRLTLHELSKVDKQIIVNTWCDITEATEPFVVVEV